MSSPVTPAPAAAQDEAGKLIEQRALLQGWLARLDEQSGSAPAHLIERVRADYLERLRLVGEQLGPHAEGIRAELEATRQQLDTADLALSEAADALGEAQLRHLIGEITGEQWSEQEPELQRALEAAQSESGRIRGECDRLAELLAGIEGEEEPAATLTEDPEPVVAEAAEVEPVEEASASTEPDEPTSASGATATAESSNDAPWLALIDSVAGEETQESDEEDAGADERDFLQWVAAAGDEDEEEDAEIELLAAEPAALEDEFGFLEELDRALAASSGTVAPPAQGNGQRVAESTTRATLLCRECGSTNDVRAWYCEICGAELS